MHKDVFYLTGKVNVIGELEQIKRQGIPDIYKRVLTIETDDGQILFPELRNRRLNLLDANSIATGNEVEVQYIFQGSEKNGKMYNNIYVSDIKNI